MQKKMELKILRITLEKKVNKKNNYICAVRNDFAEATDHVDKYKDRRQYKFHCICLSAFITLDESNMGTVSMLNRCHMLACILDLIPNMGK